MKGLVIGALSGIAVTGSMAALQKMGAGITLQKVAFIASKVTTILMVNRSIDSAYYNIQNQNYRICLQSYPMCEAFL